MDQTFLRYYRSTQIKCLPLSSTLKLGSICRNPFYTHSLEKRVSMLIIELAEMNSKKRAVVTDSQITQQIVLSGHLVIADRSVEMTIIN